MGTTTLRILDITGADLSGSSGATNRTYTLPYDQVSGTGIIIWVNGTTLHQGDDFTLTSNNLITFLNAIVDSQVINGQYYSFTLNSVNTVYADTNGLATFMGIEKTIPDASNNNREVVGTGDNSATRFWLDNMGILAGTYTIYYGASEAGLTALTETDDYTLDLDTGLLTLTSDGVTAVGTDNIYAQYTYNTLGLKHSLLANAIARAEDQIDRLTNNHFVDGTTTTPDWNQHLNEAQDGKGFYDRNYFTLQNYPIPDVSTALNGAVSADDTTITVDSTDGFPSSGSILIGGDKIDYTGKTSTTFTGCTSVSAHDDNSVVKAYVVEISTTEPGGTISWDVLKEGTEFEIDRKTGRIHLYAEGALAYGSWIDENSTPPRLVANRFRVSYLSGFSTIPDAIQKATLMVAAKDIMSLAVRKAHSNGLNSFNPDLIGVDDDAIEKLLMHFRNEQYRMI